MIELSDNLDIALAVVKEGASVFKKNLPTYNNLRENRGREVKIEADTQLNNLLLKHIRERSPYDILSEEINESARRKNDYVWILDPLDGSYNLLRGIPSYCISLALWKDNDPFSTFVRTTKNSRNYFGLHNLSNNNLRGHRDLI